ncbi:MAG: hemerythrin domain-containing protein [Candidatus Tectomicrobia bacterium]|uniref:Hemerythrin domain-containing protein n=1 Tax=Tectimicrobiota bacterium TaxID=2528274 RepID=A0A932GRI0_UNCTE|nr:hemerythrin domain-containing protein [Candidatus Tectomicrobia bacterium]
MAEVRTGKAGLCPEHIGLLDTLEELRSKLVRLGLAGDAPRENEWQSLNRGLRCFSRDLEDHMSGEETNFFPVVDWGLGAAESPTRFVLAEHQQIRRILQDIRKVLALSLGVVEDQFWPYFGRLSELLSALTSTLTSHIRSEDHIFFPLGQQILHRRMVDKQIPAQ